VGIPGNRDGLVAYDQVGIGRNSAMSAVWSFSAGPLAASWFLRKLSGLPGWVLVDIVKICVYVYTHTHKRIHIFTHTRSSQLYISSLLNVPYGGP